MRSSPQRIRRLLEMQGYLGHDDATLHAIEPWTRLAPALCLAWTAVGTALGSAAALWSLAAVATAGALLPYHPFDILYNHGLRRFTGTRPLPPHGAPRRFGCALAAMWLLAAGGGFATGAAGVGLLFGWSMVALATSPVVTGFCVPSYLWRLGERLGRNLRPARSGG